MEALQKRVSITSTMLTAMKGVKMMGLTPKLGVLIQGLRLREINIASKYRQCLICFLTLGNVLFFIVSHFIHSTSLWHALEIISQFPGIHPLVEEGLTNSVLSAYIPQLISPFLAFVIFTARSTEALNATRAFTAMSLIALLTIPLGNLLLNLIPVIGAISCFERIRALSV
jgi:ATP-binding cassette subfamily C (CFTR/MRP) protein 1